MRIAVGGGSIDGDAFNKIIEKRNFKVGASRNLSESKEIKLFGFM